MRSPAYRPDIDGLRSVAVIPVVLFHAGLRCFAGGYVGVDVFFVISGYLITGILATAMATGRYSIIDFYQRRARRIFPSLAVMTLATLAFGYLVLTPAEFVKVGTDALSIAGFVSNIHFWLSVGYFQSANTFQPFLHTWSLAVEEQFYIFFPLVLYFLHGRRNLLFPILLVIFVVSYAGSVWLVADKPRIAFYLLPGRAWELMAGAILALGQFERLWTPRSAGLAAMVGMALIGVPVFAYSGQTPFPGLAALPPVLGACLLIWARGEGLARVLTWRPLVEVGLLSYSLYLWHLPIFAYTEYLLGRPLAGWLGIALSVTSLAIAWLSVRVIEAPFRYGLSPRATTRRAIVAWAGMALVAACGAILVSSGGAPWRMTPRDQGILTVANDEARHHLECMSVNDLVVNPAAACTLGDRTAQPATLLWGDSHAMVTATAMEVAARAHHASFLFAADADCPIGLGFEIDSNFTPAVTSAGHYRICAQYNAAMLAQALRPEVRTVVLSSRWTNWRIGARANPAEAEADIRLRTAAGTAHDTMANQPIFEQGFNELIATLNGAGKQVVIVGPLPEPSFNVPHQMHIAQFGFADPVRSLTLADYRMRHAIILRYFASLGTSVKFIWPVDSLCRDGECAVERDGVPLYFDQDHLSVAAARSTAPLYETLFR